MKYGKALLKNSMLLNIAMYIIWVYNQGFKLAFMINLILSNANAASSIKQTNKHTTGPL